MHQKLGYRFATMYKAKIKIIEGLKGASKGYLPEL